MFYQRDVQPLLCISAPAVPGMVKQSCIMATLTINRATRPTLTIRQWLGRKNESFSMLCGEEFTNQQVLLAHLYCIALIVLCCVAEWLEGGAL